MSLWTRKSLVQGEMRKMSSVIHAIFVMLLLMVPNQGLFASVESTLKKMSYKEKFFLKAFFKSFLEHDSLGHVLFFDTKPTCLTSFSIDPHYQNFFEKIFDGMSNKGWEVWKKNEHLFPHPNIIFAEEVLISDGERTRHIFVINKETCVRCLEKHEASFRYILGESFTVETFITALEEQQRLFPLIHDDECLLGLILGFGPESSCAFKERNAARERGKPPSLWTENYRGIDVQKPKGCHIFPVGFVGNPESEEVKNLEKLYERELSELWSMYKQSGDTLEFILNKLCSDECKSVLNDGILDSVEHPLMAISEG